jgi:molybdopterin synthase catalytic subunit
VSDQLVPPDGDTWTGLSDQALPVEQAVAWATTPAAGAVVTFLGVVRDHADGREGVTGLTYEAYAEAAVHRLDAVAAEARRRWPVLERVALLHRVGELALSDTAVAVVASTPHRAEAFEAARFCIDTLKESVPIWKQEHWPGGRDWGTGAMPIGGVPRSEPAAPATSG